MARYEIKTEMNLQNLINETKEAAQALSEFADNLERIEKKYAKPNKENEEKLCDDSLSKEERLKMLMETGEFDFLKDIPPDKIWKLVFMLEFIGDVESEEE